MHARAMLLLKKQSFSDVTEYAAIVKALHTLDPDADAEGNLKPKFGITFFIFQGKCGICKDGNAVRA